MGVEQLNSEEVISASPELAELTEKNAEDVNFSNTKEKIKNIGLDPDTIKTSEYTESFNEEKGKIIFKPNATPIQRANMILTLLARHNKKLKNDGKPNLGGNINIQKDGNTGLYFLNTEKGPIGIQPKFIGGLKSIKQFTMSIQSSIIGGIGSKKKQQKLIVTYSNEHIGLTS